MPVTPREVASADESREQHEAPRATPVIAIRRFKSFGFVLYILLVADVHFVAVLGAVLLLVGVQLRTANGGTAAFDTWLLCLLKNIVHLVTIEVTDVLG
jgi:hypothetical protein